jgi:hypothetical protein
VSEERAGEPRSEPTTGPVSEERAGEPRSEPTTGPVSEERVNTAVPQRTRLAWRRTVLATAVVGLLLVRLAVAHHAAWLAPAAAALWLVTAFAAQVRIGALAAATPPPVRRALPVVALATLGYAALGAAAVLLAGPDR